MSTENKEQIQKYVNYIRGCIVVIIDAKGDVFTTGKEVGQIQVYISEINKILNENKNQ